MIRYLCILVLFPLQVFSQTLISASVGYGTYQMNDMAALQNELKASVPVDAKKVLVFPGYWFYETSFQKVISEKLVTGGMIAYGSTAGRVSYSDYSGNINIDQLLASYSIQAQVGRYFKLNDNRTLTADLQPGVNYTTLDMVFHQAIGSQSQSEKLNFSSLNLNVQPAISCTQRIKKFGLQVKLGYHLTVMSGKLKFDGHDDAYLIDRNEKPIAANWSGLRLSAGLVYFIRE